MAAPKKGAQSGKIDRLRLHEERNNYFQERLEFF